MAAALLCSRSRSDKCSGIRQGRSYTLTWNRYRASIEHALHVVCCAITPFPSTICLPEVLPTITDGSLRDMGLGWQSGNITADKVLPCTTSVCNVPPLRCECCQQKCASARRRLATGQATAQRNHPHVAKSSRTVFPATRCSLDLKLASIGPLAVWRCVARNIATAMCQTRSAADAAA